MDHRDVALGERVFRRKVDRPGGLAAVANNWETNHRSVHTFGRLCKESRIRCHVVEAEPFLGVQHWAKLIWIKASPRGVRTVFDHSFLERVSDRPNGLRVSEDM